MNEQTEAGPSTGRNVRPCRRREKEPLASPDASDGEHEDEDVLSLLDRLGEGASWRDMVNATVRADLFPDLHDYPSRLLRMLSTKVHPDKYHGTAREHVATRVQKRLNAARAACKAHADTLQRTEAAHDAQAPTPPWLVSSTVASQLLRTLREAEQVTRAAIQAAVRETSSSRSGTFTDIEHDAYVAIYDCETATWSVSNCIVTTPGRAFWGRIQVLFAPLHVQGQGKNENGAASRTFANLSQFILGRIARRVAQEDSNVTSIAFIIVNSLPSMAFVPREKTQCASDVHLAFDAGDETTSLGHLSHEHVRAIVPAAITRVLDACAHASRGAGYALRIDVHSRKVEVILDKTLHSRVVDTGGTFDEHPSSRAQLAPGNVSIFRALQEQHACVFANICDETGVQSVVQFDVVDPELKAARASYRGRIDDAKSTVINDHGDVMLFAHQKFAVREILQRFVDGRPGSVLHLDTGLGKTFIMFATTYVALKSEAVVGCTWFLESFSCSGELGLHGPRKAFASFLHAMGESAVGINTLCERVNVCKTGYRGKTLDAMREALLAANADRDHMFFLDEASRYVGDLRNPSALVKLFDHEVVGITGRVFRVAMTATPFTSDVTRLFNLFTLIGATYDRNRVLECAQSIVGEYRSSCAATMNSRRAELQGTAIADLRTLLDDMCVGHASMAREPSATRSVQLNVTRLGIERTVVVFTAQFPDETLMTRLLESAGANRRDVLTLLELAPGLAFGLCRNSEVKNAYFGLESSSHLSPLTTALLRSTAAAREKNEPVLVIFPSNIAAVLHFVYHEIRAVVPNATAVDFVDQSTSQEARVAIFDNFNNSANATDGVTLLLVTTCTSGYGIDLTNVRFAVNVSCDWVDANQTQSMSRVGRMCARTGDTEGTTSDPVRFVSMMPIADSTATNLRRFHRAASRGQLAALLFPAPLHSDREPLLLRGVFDHAQLTPEHRAIYRAKYGLDLFETLLDGDEYAEISYGAFMQILNGVIENSYAPDLSFLVHDTRVQFDRPVDDDEDVVHASDARHRQGAVGQRQGAARGSRAANAAKVDAGVQTRFDAAIVFCSRRQGQLPKLSTVEHENATATAAQLAEQFLREFEKGEQNWATTLNDAHHGHYYLLKFDTKSQYRKQIVFASSWSIAGRGYNKGGGKNATRSPFPPATPRPLTPGEEARIAYGIQNEEVALRHVVAKYGLELIPHVKHFTKLHETHPQVLAGSADAITTSGLLIEIKCVLLRQDFLELVANKRRWAIDKHCGQVQALLELYNLPAAILCYWHREDTSENGEEVYEPRPDPETLSYELVIYRESGWWARESKKMMREINKQKLTLGHLWNDEIMHISGLVNDGMTDR